MEKDTKDQQTLLDELLTAKLTLANDVLRVHSKALDQLESMVYETDARTLVQLTAELRRSYRELSNDIASQVISGKPEGEAEIGDSRSNDNPELTRLLMEVSERGGTMYG